MLLFQDFVIAGVAKAVTFQGNFHGFFVGDHGVACLNAGVGGFLAGNQGVGNFLQGVQDGGLVLQGVLITDGLGLGVLGAKLTAVEKRTGQAGGDAPSHVAAGGKR